MTVTNDPGATDMIVIVTEMAATENEAVTVRETDDIVTAAEKE